MEDRHLDEETQAALLGLMPVTQGATLDFIPPAFEPLPEGIRPVFQLRAWSREEKRAVLDFEEQCLKELAPFAVRGEEGAEAVIYRCTDETRVHEFARIRRMQNEQRAEFARIAVMGWRRVLDPLTAQPIVFPDKAPADEELFGGFALQARTEIYDRVARISSLTQAEKEGLR